MTMQIRSGVDIIEISRLENLDEKIRYRFYKRVFTTRELSLIKNSFPSAAGRFAVKEAVSKALGEGIGDIRWKDIEILQGKTGEPQLFLHNKALELSKRLSVDSWSVSISHSREYAVALVVALSSQ
jgi:holo-[acyl-carrier protein] synthase